MGGISSRKSFHSTPKQDREGPIAWEDLRIKCNSKPTSRSTKWTEVPNECIIETLKTWILSTEAVSVEDKLRLAAFSSIVDGIEKGAVRNGLLDGGEEYGVRRRTRIVGIDRGMQRLAGFRFLKGEEADYIIWLQFARRAKLRKGTNIFSASGPLYSVPSDEWQMAPLLGVNYGVEDEHPGGELESPSREHSLSDNIETSQAC